jgi:hypothetical protein
VGQNRDKARAAGNLELLCAPRRRCNHADRAIVA